MTAVELVEDFLANGPATSVKIAKGVGLPRQVVSSTISNLVTKKRVVKVGEEPNDESPRPYAVYDLSEPVDRPTVPPELIVASALASRSPLELAWSA